eukprot:CAMPEP_0119264676 /NCGR_PEP_ID=MMETSP1329-20130426/3693_1 /TAXON_ID=114041 /ORGANISM="Genus nov. species nov., Strain RCC1024" /LENGTH=74 /DNA_ID=CAMNT_0007264461 /DNA_START=12 /DNA_END=233 /DNA_ORIENTATION=+
MLLTARHERAAASKRDLLERRAPWARPRRAPSRCRGGDGRPSRKRGHDRGGARRSGVGPRRCKLADFGVSYVFT